MTRRSGFSMMLVLMVLGVLTLLCTAGTLLMNPAGTALDTHLAALRARELADGAVQQALANLDAGRAPDFQSADVAAHFDGTNLQVTASAPVAGQTVARTELRASATLEKTDGRWQVRSFVIEN